MVLIVPALVSVIAVAGRSDAEGVEAGCSDRALIEHAAGIAIESDRGAVVLTAAPDCTVMLTPVLPVVEVTVVVEGSACPYRKPPLRPDDGMSTPSVACPPVVVLTQRASARDVSANPAKQQGRSATAGPRRDASRSPQRLLAPACTPLEHDQQYREILHAATYARRFRLVAIWQRLRRD